MRIDQTPKTNASGWGWFCITAGVAIAIYPAAVAIRLLPAGAAGVHAPMWVVFLCGLVIVMGGVMMLVGQRSRINDLLACVLLLFVGAIGAWVAIGGSADGFSGGIPFLTHKQNVTAARWVFGLGALVCLLFSGYAARGFFRPRG